MRLRNKLAIAAVSTVAAVSVASAAFAYWTTTGSGSGNAAAAQANGTLALHASFAPGLAPGQSEAVSYSADNSSATDLQVGTVHAVVSTSNNQCDPAWFSIADVVEGQVIGNGQTGVALTHGGTLYFNNNAANQDACKGATVTLTLSA